MPFIVMASPRLMQAYDRLDVIPFDKMESFFRQYMG